MTEGQEKDCDQALDRILGYLNFSEAGADPKFFAAINHVYRQCESQTGPKWKTFRALLDQRAEVIRNSIPAFSDIRRAVRAIALTFDHLRSAYFSFHKDLLFHQDRDQILNAYFVGRMFEAVARHSAPWDDTEMVVKDAIQNLNDFVGYRPVPVLESRRHEAYPHEKIRPIPLFIRGAGPVANEQGSVLKIAMQILQQTDQSILADAAFYLENLEELAVDPRAYDFDHPANKRPNHLYGMWDPHRINQQGKYERFVVQHVTLDALMERCASEPNLDREELQIEAAAVLAGTILMASGISGDRPEAHDSTMSLGKLLPRIAKFRDAFYDDLIEKLKGAHRKRLLQEAKAKRQPFGAARQHLNAQLARYRASQMERVHLALVFAKLGFPDEAHRQAGIVPSVSARIRSQLECLLYELRQRLDRMELAEASEKLPKIHETILRGINCGAIVDPWNILGFDAHFSLFPSPENSVRDQRIDELVELVEDTFAIHSRLWSEAAARGDRALVESTRAKFHDLATWWDQFAADQVSSVESTNAWESFRSSERVAEGLRLWHEGGSTAQDVAFWARHAKMFDSAKAYALVVEALLDRNDLAAAMALLIHWVGQSESVGLQKGDVSFYATALRCFKLAIRDSNGWVAARRFLDHLEANAENLWRATDWLRHRRPLSGEQSATSAAPEDSEDDDDSDSLFDAAYENVVYRDSTDDGIEGSVFEGGGHPDEMEWADENQKLVVHLDFHVMQAELWKLIALRSVGLLESDQKDSPPRQISERERSSPHADLLRWAQQASSNLSALLQLVNSLSSIKLRPSQGDHDSLLEYDRARVNRESLIERVIHASVEIGNAARLLYAAERASAVREPAESATEPPATASIELINLFAVVMRRDATEARKLWSSFISDLETQSLLYIPIARGGSPETIVATRLRQHAIQDLLTWLPRLSMIFETCQLIDTAREMERRHPVTAGAVTEFDELYRTGYRAIVESLIDSSFHWKAAVDPAKDFEEGRQIALASCLEQLTQILLVTWLAHSRTLRLSVLEKVKDRKPWKRLVHFIETFGEELFTQRFLNLANIRAILHQGVEKWLERVKEEGRDDEQARKILESLEDDSLASSRTEESSSPSSSSGEGRRANSDRSGILDQFSLVLEAIVENYAEYRDYNSTTTQSDRGELLYILLDFLRLRNRYDRVCWNLRPVVYAHEILVRRGQDTTARTWRRSLVERIGGEADQFIRELAELQKKYAVRMPTVSDKISERFLRPLNIDRIRALVSEVAKEGELGKPNAKFDILKFDVEQLAGAPTGVGFDLPAWIAALEEEVDRVRRPIHERLWEEELREAIPFVHESLDSIQQQLDALGTNR